MLWKRNKEEVASADGSVNENVTWFWVNRNGFPLDDKTYLRLWRHVCKLHPKGDNLASEIKNSKHLEEVPVVSPPTFHRSHTVEQRIELVQQYLLALQYNHTGTQFFDIRKEKPLSGMVNDAKLMIRECLPIKCLEAVILATYLTHPFEEIERFSIGFKTKLGNTIHKHVVLAIMYNGRFGAIGLSRREELMYKPVVFESLAELLEEYVQCYKSVLHSVKKITLSNFIPHSILSFEPIHWKYTAIDCKNITSSDLKKESDRHMRKARSDLFSITPPRRLSQPPSFSKHNKVANGNPAFLRMSEPNLAAVRAPVVTLSTGFGGV